MTIDWVQCLKQIKTLDFSLDLYLGSSSYEDREYGQLNFLWRANKSTITILWYPFEPICWCGLGMENVDCGCEWAWFTLLSEPIEKTFKKKDFFRLKAPSLF